MRLIYSEIKLFNRLICNTYNPIKKRKIKVPIVNVAMLTMSMIFNGKEISAILTM